MKLTKIGIIGQQCAGKTTAANIICEHFSSEIKFVKFADPIYATLSAHKQNKNRKFMQEFSDVAKKYFGKDIYVECFKASIKEQECVTVDFHTGMETQERLIICDDIRYKYEFDACKELGFKVIALDTVTKIRKKRAEKVGLEFIENHSSETEIPDFIYKADFVIIDQGISKRKLKKYVKNALKQFSL